MPVCTCIYSALQWTYFGTGRFTAPSFGTLLQTWKKSGMGDHSVRIFTLHSVFVKFAGAKGFLRSFLLNVLFYVMMIL